MAIGSGKPVQFPVPNHDTVGFVTKLFFNSSSIFRRSEVERQRHRNGWTISGSWPPIGGHEFDWEIETWGERGGDVIVRANVWIGGKREGIAYRANVVTAERLIPKFLRWFYGRIRKTEDVMLRKRSYLNEQDLDDKDLNMYFVGPKDFAKGDIVTMGASTPYKIVDVDEGTVYLEPVGRAGRRGPVRLFWDDDTGKYKLMYGDDDDKEFESFLPKEINVVKKSAR